MRKFKIGICDDEKGTCAGIEESVYRFFSSNEGKVDVDVWFSGEECISTLQNDPLFDILFLDIEFPGINGVDVGRFIRNNLKNDTLQIVYISSKTEYALELFQVHPYDFLVKPISFDNIACVLSKLLELDMNNQKPFRYKIGQIEGKLPIGKIMYLESNGKHVKVHCADGTSVIYIGKLANEAKKLPNYFVTVAKSYIVNLNYVTSFGKLSLRLQDGNEINVTAPNRENFRKQITDFFEAPLSDG